MTNLYYIFYELEGPIQEYPEFIDAIQNLGPGLQLMENCWAVVTDEPAGLIMDAVRPLVGPVDKVLVIQNKGDSAWNLSEELSDWLTETINSSWIPNKD